MRIRTFAAVALAGASLLATAPAMADVSLGTVGTRTGADGDISAAPAPGGPGYSFVSTTGGVAGVGQLAGYGGVNGSEYLTSAFSADSGDSLVFNFNYLTSDGAGYADYGFAELLTNLGAHVAYLFTARTVPSGDTSPGTGLPANDATLTPLTSAIIGGTAFSGIASSGGCYAAGCGHTGWIQSSYTIADSGSYVLRIGVTNVLDSNYDTALAFSGVQVDGEDIPTPDAPVPEPASWAMMLGGFGMLGAAMRRRRTTVAFG